MNYFVGLLVLTLLVQQVVSLFFILGEKERRCFYDEYEDDVMMKFEFNATLHKATTATGLQITVLGPENKVMLMKEYGSQSVASFRTSEPGEYAMCVGTNSSKWAMYASDSIMVHFRFNVQYMVDEDVEDEKAMKASVHEIRRLRNRIDEEKEGKNDKEGNEDDEDEDLNEEEHEHLMNDPVYLMGERVHEVKKAIKWITEMQNTNRRVEEKFREIAETTNSRVFIWAFVQLALLLLTGWWQMRSLKSFFLLKKIA